MAADVVGDAQCEIYIDCIRKQLEEVDLLSSIYCTAGEMTIYDPSIISDFNEFLKMPSTDAIKMLRAQLDYCISLTLQNSTLSQGLSTTTTTTSKDKLEVRIELPHLYPALEHAIVTIRSAILSKTQEVALKEQIEQFITTMDRNETYVFQVITWIQDKIVDFITSSIDIETPNVDDLVDLERLWIYSHHIKSKTKRHEILKESRNLNLSGFSRPGKPGIICVEGLQENTQEFWRIIKSMHWQKITICKSEITRKSRSKIDKFRRFNGFKEQLFSYDEANDEDAVMDMSMFIKFLETHNSGYMKKELFGLI